MIIKVLANQIPVFWETIKFAVKTVDNVKEDSQQEYLNLLLQSLLSDKAQCFIIMNDERVLQALCITKILHDKALVKNYMYIHCLYAFHAVEENLWQKGLDAIHTFAKNNDCAYISLSSMNKRIWDIVSTYGFEESERVFKLGIGGI